MKKRGTLLIIAGFISAIIMLAIINIIEFQLTEFYALIVMISFFIKYILIKRREWWFNYVSGYALSFIWW